MECDFKYIDDDTNEVVVIIHKKGVRIEKERFPYVPPKDDKEEAKSEKNNNKVYPISDEE